MSAENDSRLSLEDPSRAVRRSPVPGGDEETPVAIDGDRAALAAGRGTLRGAPMLTLPETRLVMEGARVLPLAGDQRQKQGKGEKKREKTGNVRPARVPPSSI